MNPKKLARFIGRSAVVLPALGLFCVSSTAFAAYQTWTNDVWPLDNNGNPIMAQAGGITKTGNTYYWYGIQYPNDASYYNGRTGKSIASGHGINCYSSTDLVHWTFVNRLTTHQSTGRMGQIAYNSTNNQYVIWANDGNGTPWCYTGSTLTGNYSFYGSQAVVTNEYTGGGTQITGDCTLFIDDDNGGTPYFITSDPHGRQHAYVCPLSADYLTIGNAVAINNTAGVPAWPQGQEANDVFERNGIYYYITSDLAGYSYSAGYAVWSANLLSATSYTPDAYFQGTTADYTRYSQVSFGFRVAGTMATNYIMVGDRWCEENGNYASAGYGDGFSIMCPMTFTNGVPYFNSVHEFQVDTVTGRIRPATIADVPTNLTTTASEGQVPGQVALSWVAVDGATAYNVYRSTTNGGPYAALASPTSNSYTDTGLQNGTTYFYVVTSTNVFGESTNSAQVNATPSIGPLITAASASPDPVFPGQILTISATVAAQANPIATVTVNVSAIGGLTNQTLVSDGVGNYTNNVTVGGTTMVGTQTLTVNASDNLGNVASPYPFSLTVGSLVETWDGGGSDDNWSNDTNWGDDAAPPPGLGCSLIFAGSTRLTPLMDGSYNLYAVTFDNTAGTFTIGTTGGTLTLTGGLTNNSSNAQTLNVPVILGAPVTVNAASADVALGQTVNNGGNLLTITDGGHNTAVNSAISGGGGLTKSGTGTNMLSGVNTFGGNITISNGTLAIGGAGQLGSGAYSGTIADSGTLTYGSTAAQTLSGIISGTGGLNQNGSGPLTLTAANTLFGPTTVTGGTLQVSNTLALQNSTLNNNGGNVTFSGITAATLGGLSGTQNLGLTNAVASALTLTVGGNNASTIYSGGISGSGSLTKAGTGTLTLSGANIYTGNTTVLGGNLTVGGGTINAPASTILIGNGATGVSFNVTNGTVMASTLNVAPNGGSTGDSASITGSGSATFASVNLGSSGNTSGPLTINTTGSVALGALIDYRDLAGNGPSAANGLIINKGIVTATSIIIQNYASGANMNMTGGSLTIGNAASTGAFKIGNGGSTRGRFLTMTGGSLTYLGTDGLFLNTLSGSANGANISGATSVVTVTGVTLNQVNAAGATSWLVVSNGATLYLGGVGLVMNQPSATVFASFGTAMVGAIANWSSTAPITLAGTATFQAADASSVAHNISLGGTLSGTGNLAKTGSGTLILSGTNTYAGSTCDCAWQPVQTTTMSNTGWNRSVNDFMARV